MEYLKFSADRTLSCLNQQWCTLFPYTYLRFFDSTGKGAGDWTKLHGSIRKKGDSIVLPVFETMKVKTFEELYEAAFDARIEVCYGLNKALYQTNDEQNQKTLSEMNYWAMENGADKFMEKHPYWFYNNCLIDGHIYEIFPEHDPKLRIDVQWGKPFNGAKLWLYENDNSSTNKAQLFQAMENTDGTSTFLSLLNKEFAIDMSHITSHPCHMWTYNSNNRNQKFILKKSTKGGFYLHCLKDQNFVWDVEGSRGHESNLINFKFHGNDNQIFHFKPLLKEL